MNRTVAICICLTILSTINKEQRLNAEVPEYFKTPAGADAAELSKLAVEYERLSKLRREAIKATSDGLDGGGKPSDEKLSDEEWLEAGRENDSKSIYSAREILSGFFG